MKTDEAAPVAEVVRRCMNTQRLTFRALAAATKRVDPSGRGLTYSYLGGIARGRDTPSLESMELIARALDTAPSSFLEYRLGIFRRHFDEQYLGLAQASANLREIVGWLSTGSVRARSQLARSIISGVRREP